MKQPITLVLMLPTLMLCFAFLGDNWGYGFVLIVILGFLLEIRLKKGEISRKSVREFFNTPMNPKGETEKQMLARNNLEYKFSPLGLLVCLCWLFVAPYFGIQLYSEYKNWSFPIDIDTILGVTYLMGLGILYRLFFVKTVGVRINLKNVSDKESLFSQLDKSLIIKPWGHNWDALNDCLRDLDEGGFTKKYTFPLVVKITDWKTFQSTSPSDFQTFRDILESQIKEHAEYGKQLSVVFVE